MPIELRRKGRHTVQVAVFERKTTRSGKSYIELDFCGVRLLAGKEAIGATYRIEVREPIYVNGEFRGRFTEFKFQRTYDISQRLDEIFYDFFDENPDAGSERFTIKYSFNQWLLKHESGLLEGWAGFILPPVRM